jgi:hypothetical protein
MRNSNKVAEKKHAVHRYSSRKRDAENIELAEDLFNAAAVTRAGGGTAAGAVKVHCNIVTIFREPLM